MKFSFMKLQTATVNVKSAVSARHVNGKCEWVKINILDLF